MLGHEAEVLVTPKIFCLCLQRKEKMSYFENNILLLSNHMLNDDNSYAIIKTKTKKSLYRFFKINFKRKSA